MSEPKPTSANPMTSGDHAPTPAAGGGDARLIPAYLFEEFVVGAHNRFPHAAALAVSENLGKAYNPLFIYGPVGIGKTHLMQAVGHRVLQRDPNTRVLYVTAQQFMTEVIELLQAGKLQTLRDRYRALDLFLVDDIQFLATSEATQEEFFHTFNDLHASGKQIIMTSDRPPKMLTTLEDRLRSRFEWGLIADVKPTNLETRIAILRKKEVHLKGLHLPDEIILYIASRLKSNVRELEGFLRRIQAYTQLNAQEITLPLVQEILKELLPPEEWTEEGGKPTTPVEIAPPPASQPQDIAEARPESPPPPPPPPPPKAEVPPPPAQKPPPPPKVERPAPPPPPEPTTEPMPIPEISSEASPPTPSPEAPQIVHPAKAPFTPPPIVRPAQLPRGEGGPPPKSPFPTPLPGKPTPMPGAPGPLPPMSPPLRPGAPVGGPPPAGASRPPMPSIKPPTPPPAVKPPTGPTVNVPGTLSPNTGAIPVAFFYPLAQEKELDRMRKKFEEIIKKHKLKFTLHSAMESAYPMDASLNYDDFLTKCTDAQVSIAIVLGPPPESAIQETVFFNQLQEALDRNQVSLQMVPWDELGKDYRFLNLALDITLLRIKQKKS